MSSNLVLLSQTDSMMGKIASAAVAVTRIWRHYGSLVSLITCQKFDQYSLYHPEMIVLLQRIKHELATQPGRPLTPYRLRPGEDNRPVWQSFNDASRRTDSWFGAAGGWFRLWETDVVFYFWHRWPAEHVEQCNISELEPQRKLKEGKHQREQRALAVARAQNFAYSVIEYDASRWDVIDAPDAVEKYVANFTTNAGDGKQGKQ
eukprot:COSAG06_NODE_20304_length_800_cov_2.840228_1_plen_203_part_10